MAASAIYRHGHHQVNANAGSALASGDIVVLSDGRIGVVAGLEAIVSGDPVGYTVTGQHDLLSASGTTFSVGDSVFWNPSTLLAVATAVSGCVYAGRAVKAKVSGDTRVLTDINVQTPPRLPVLSTAATGSSQSDAAALIEGLNVVSGADGTKGVVLPTAVAGMKVLVKGTTAGVLKIYPATGGTINALSANAAISLASGAIPSILVASSATQWYTFPLVAS